MTDTTTSNSCPGWESQDLEFERDSGLSISNIMEFDLEDVSNEFESFSNIIGEEPTVLDDTAWSEKTALDEANPIIPNFSGFQEYVQRLHPAMELNYLVDRIAYQQVVRYKKLLGCRVKHEGVIAAGKCTSLSHCTSQSGRAKLFDLSRDTGDNAPSKDAPHLYVSDGDSILQYTLTPEIFPPGMPMPPTSTLPALFECQLCFRVKRFQKPSDWTKHVYEDLKPYTCTYSNCPEMKNFKRKANWIRHENQCHRHLEWWACDVDSCTYKAFRWDTFHQHIVCEHKLEEPHAKFKSRSKAPAEPDELVGEGLRNYHYEIINEQQDEPCHFCGLVFTGWKSLAAHLAKHMERISLTVLKLVNQQPTVVNKFISRAEQPLQLGTRISSGQEADCLFPADCGHNSGPFESNDGMLHDSRVDSYIGSGQANVDAQNLYHLDSVYDSSYPAPDSMYDSPGPDPTSFQAFDQEKANVDAQNPHPLDSVYDSSYPAPDSMYDSPVPDPTSIQAFDQESNPFSQGNKHNEHFIHQDREQVGKLFNIKYSKKPEKKVETNIGSQFHIKNTKIELKYEEKSRKIFKAKSEIDPTYFTHVWSSLTESLTLHEQSRVLQNQNPYSTELDINKLGKSSPFSSLSQDSESKSACETESESNEDESQSTESSLHSKFNEWQQNVYEQIMLAFWNVWNQKSMLIVLVCTKSMPINTTAGSNSNSASQSQPTSFIAPLTGALNLRESMAKRERNDDDDSSPDDGNRGPKRPKRDLTPVSEPTARFACPFRKHSPRKYNMHHSTWRACAISSFESVSRIKEHLYRKHKAPIQCVRCWIFFKNQDNLNIHLQALNICTTLPGQPVEGITSVMVDKLKSRKKSCADQTEEDRWRRMYGMIFPDAEIPSPYFEPVSDDLAQPHESIGLPIEEFMLQQLPQYISSRLEIEIFNMDVENYKEALDDQGRLREIFATCVPRLVSEAVEDATSAYRQRLSADASLSNAFATPPHSLTESSQTSLGKSSYPASHSGSDYRPRPPIAEPSSSQYPQLAEAQASESEPTATQDCGKAQNDGTMPDMSTSADVMQMSPYQLWQLPEPPTDESLDGSAQWTDLQPQFPVAGFDWSEGFNDICGDDKD